MPRAARIGTLVIKWGVAYSDSEPLFVMTPPKLCLYPDICPSVSSGPVSYLLPIPLPGVSILHDLLRRRTLTQDSVVLLTAHWNIFT